MNGYDISSYQAQLNPAAVPADFVIIKSTEGTSYINPTWQTQANQTLQVHKLLGLYHFASGGQTIAEADHFVNVIQPYVGKALLVLDFEAGAINAWGDVGARQFLNRVTEKTGVHPLIYMSAEVTRQFNWSLVASSYGLWVAQYGSMSPTGYQSQPWTDGKGYGAWSSAAIHQYSSTGKLPNWGGNLDLNLAYLSASDWQTLARVGGGSVVINQNSDIKINLENEEEDMHFIQTVDTKRIYMINAGMYSWITNPGMWSNYKKAFPNAPVIPLYQAEMEKLYRKNA